MGSFFHTLKTELVHQGECPYRDATWRYRLRHIEGYYDRRRLHSAIVYITPGQAEATSV
jgi:transposase InsO family protein